MPKYLILKHYRGGPDQVDIDVPFDQWTPEEVDAHMAFQHDIARVLQENGEFVDAQALTRDGAWVRYGGRDAAPVVTDGPFAEAKEVVAGWFMIDVESQERAYEVAAWVSSAPGKDGKPIHEWLQVRQVMEDRAEES